MTNVIPIPFQVDQGNDKIELTDGMSIGYTEPSLGNIAEIFCSEVSRRTGLNCFHNGSVFDASVLLQLKSDDFLESIPFPIGVSPSTIWIDERYSLEINKPQIKIKSPSIEGLTHGLTTLLQILSTTPKTENSIFISEKTILDGPRFSWRNFSLDLARSYLSIEEIKRVIDLIALYKLNVLTLHLSDNNNWRIQPGRKAEQLETKSSDLYYSNDELTELVKYANDRFVTIVPEIDGPGYATALMKLRPELVSEHNSNAHWLDPQLPATYPIMKDVLSQISSIFFTSKYINIGADEPAGMPENLYIIYVQEIKAFIRSLGKETMGWQKSIRAGIDPYHLLQFWKSNSKEAKEEIKKALDNKVPIIVSPVSHTYLDTPYAENSTDPIQEEKRRRIGLRSYPPKSVETSYDWDPTTALGLNLEEEKLAGVGSTIWYETIQSFDDLCFLMLPRLAGVAEKAWSSKENTDWEDHRHRVAYHKQLWQQDGLDYFLSSSIDWAYADEQYFSGHYYG